MIIHFSNSIFNGIQCYPNGIERYFTDINKKVEQFQGIKKTFGSIGLSLVLQIRGTKNNFKKQTRQQRKSRFQFLMTTLCVHAFKQTYEFRAHTF